MNAPINPPVIVKGPDGLPATTFTRFIGPRQFPTDNLPSLGEATDYESLPRDEKQMAYELAKAATAVSKLEKRVAKTKAKRFANRHSQVKAYAKWRSSEQGKAFSRTVHVEPQPVKENKTPTDKREFRKALGRAKKLINQTARRGYDHVQWVTRGMKEWR